MFLPSFLPLYTEETRSVMFLPSFLPLYTEETRSGEDMIDGPATVEGCGKYTQVQ